MKPTTCPSCRQLMQKYPFQRTLGGEVILDLCFPCQGIWFDEYENLQITPGSVIELFQLIDAHRDDQRQPLGDILHCPRCVECLIHGMDVSKHGGRFNYHRCLQKHGRFTTFAQFMIEKGFVRQLNPVEIHTLAARIGIIHCTGCGAPVDIRKKHACDHCKAPIAILDPQAVEQALSRFQQAEVKRSAPPDFEKMADALLLQEKSTARFPRQSRREQQVDGNISVGDLLLSGVALVLSLLNK